MKRSTSIASNCAPLLFLVVWCLHAIAQANQPIVPQVVDFPSGKLHLKGYLWLPAGHGPFPAVLFNHGSGGKTADLTADMQITEAAAILAPFFIEHGYAFFYPFRRGQGLSSDQAPFMLDLAQREEKEKGADARQHLMFVFATTDQLDDVISALAFLKTVPDIDTHRIALVGHSFGGVLTLLAAERDSSICAVVTFAAAATSWARSPELRDRLLAAVRKTQAPLMLIHAENDFDTTPAKSLSDELERLHKAHVLKIYPKVGLTSEDGHNMLYKNIPAWEDDVFNFLDKCVKPSSASRP